MQHLILAAFLLRCPQGFFGTRCENRDSTAFGRIEGGEEGLTGGEVTSYIESITYYLFNRRNCWGICGIHTWCWCHNHSSNVHIVLWP